MSSTLILPVFRSSGTVPIPPLWSSNKTQPEIINSACAKLVLFRTLPWNLTIHSGLQPDEPANIFTKQRARNLKPHVSSPAISDSLAYGSVDLYFIIYNYKYLISLFLDLACTQAPASVHNNASVANWAPSCPCTPSSWHALFVHSYVFPL